MITGAGVHVIHMCNYHFNVLNAERLLPVRKHPESYMSADLFRDPFLECVDALGIDTLHVL